jgi:uncharacterized cupin superfamily protein
VPWKTLQGGDVGDKNPPGYWAEWARSADFGKGWHSVGDALGVTAFGINIAEANAGEELLVPHTETAYGGQEEVYVVTSGRVRFVCDGAAVEVAEGGLLHATHEVMREATALEDGTMVVCVGGVPA